MTCVEVSRIGLQRIYKVSRIVNKWATLDEPLVDLAQLGHLRDQNQIAQHVGQLELDREKKERLTRTQKLDAC